MSLLCYRPQYLPNGGIQWLLVKPWTSSSGRYTQYCTCAPPRPSKRPLCRCICLLLFVCLLPWRPLGQYGASSCPMAVSSGFRSSPGHAALGGAVCIAPVHRCGHQNGRRMRYICSLLPTFSLTLFVAKDHVMVS
jgi:hypothetical protein